jgi:hypothetical protein
MTQWKDWSKESIFRRWSDYAQILLKNSKILEFNVRKYPKYLVKGRKYPNHPKSDMIFNTSHVHQWKLKAKDSIYSVFIIHCGVNITKHAMHDLDRLSMFWENSFGRTYSKTGQASICESNPEGCDHQRKFGL